MARRARGWWDGAAARARASSKDAAMDLAVALAPAAVVFGHGRAAAHFLCQLDAVMGSARARGRGFSQCDGCPLMSAACYSPRLLLRGLVGGARKIATRGSPGWGQNTQDDFPLARPREELLCLLFGSVGEREWPEASVRD